MLNDKFYTFEGGEGVGKTTAIALLKEKLEKEGQDVLITREPGGDKIAERIRNIILDNDINLKTEILLFAAARAEHLYNVVIPALEAGKTVISDRYVDSSIVYQQVVQGGEQVWEINDYAIGGFLPKATFLFDLDPEIAQARINDNNREQNRFDQYDSSFHTKIRNAYLELAENNKERIIVIDANNTPDKIVDLIIEEMK